MQRKLGLESLEPRQLLAATIVEYAGIGYVFAEFAPRVDRYDIASESWLSPLTLEGRTRGAKVAHVDDDGIFVGHGMDVHRYDLNGANGRLVRSVDRPVTGIVADGPLLFIGARTLYSIDKRTDLLLGSFTSNIMVAENYSIGKRNNRIYGVDTSSGPVDVLSVQYRDDGSFIGDASTPYYDPVSEGTKSWVVDDDRFLVTDAGVVRAAGNLNYNRGLATRVTDLALTDSGDLIVLDGNKLTRFNSKQLPLSEATVEAGGTDLLVGATNAVVFIPDVTQASGFRTTAVSLTDLKTPRAGRVVDPIELAYTPTQAEVTSNGQILLLSKENQSLFRWHSLTQRYLPTIPLIGSPDRMAYSADTNTVYLSYAGGLIRQVRLNDAEPREVPYLALAYQGEAPRIMTAGKYVFVTETRTTYTPGGDVADTLDRIHWYGFGGEHTWNQANQRFYYLDAWLTPSVHWAELNESGHAYPGEPPGGLGKIDNAFPMTTHQMYGPVFVSPDGGTVLLGSGELFDGDTLAVNSKRFNASISDAVWVGGHIYTLDGPRSNTRIQSWDAQTFIRENEVYRTGAANALVALPNDRLLVISIAPHGVPTFVVFDSELRPIEFLPGDTDYDGSVDLRDLQIIRNWFGGFGFGDNDGDDDADLADMQAARRNFGATTESRFQELLRDATPVFPWPTFGAVEPHPISRADTHSRQNLAAADAVFDQISGTAISNYLAGRSRSRVRRA